MAYQQKKIDDDGAQRFEDAVFERQVAHAPVGAKRLLQIDWPACLANVAVRHADVLDVHALLPRNPGGVEPDAVRRFVEAAVLDRDVAHRARADAEIGRAHV